MLFEFGSPLPCKLPTTFLTQFCLEIFNCPNNSRMGWSRSSFFWGGGGGAMSFMTKATILNFFFSKYLIEVKKEKIDLEFFINPCAAEKKSPTTFTPCKPPDVQTKNPSPVTARGIFVNKKGQLHKEIITLCPDDPIEEKTNPEVKIAVFFFTKTYFFFSLRLVSECLQQVALRRLE